LAIYGTKKTFLVTLFDEYLDRVLLEAGLLVDVLHGEHLPVGLALHQAHLRDQTAVVKNKVFRACGEKTNIQAQISMTFCQ
jgi:hypothetical protein